MTDRSRRSRTRSSANWDGRTTGPRQSPILDASVRYWTWLGAKLQSWANQIGKRRRSWFVFGGCFTWVFVILFVMFAYVLAFGAAIIFVGILALIGALLSAVGGIDQLRLNVFRRE